ncbi:MAG TPA: MFS transporter [Acidimicrobiales bacterium]|nr:MFS transporter [Acidimicrobiales bacterium]
MAPLTESREFRLLFTGQLVSFFGRQLTIVASALQIFLLTDSSLQVGLLSLAQLGPIIICSFIGGTLADAMDRRKLLMIANVTMAITSVGLAVNAMGSHPKVWAIYVFTAIGAGLSSIDSPTRSAVVPTLVRRDQIPAAAALNQTGYQFGSVAGPAFAGVVIGTVSLSAAYWIDVITFAIALVALIRLPPLLPHGGGTKAGFGSIMEGLRYARRERVVQGVFLIDINAMVFGMPRALFPQLGTELYHGGAGTVGLLYAAPAAGAFLGAVTTGWVGSIRRQGAAVLWAVAVWGLAIAAFGMATWLPLGLLMLAIAGAADVISAVFRGTILQLHVPDRLRGRLQALNIAVVTGGPRLGDLEAGAVATATTAQVSVVSGGVLCLAGVAILARALPDLAAWRAIEHDTDNVNDLT